VCVIILSTFFIVTSLTLAYTSLLSFTNRVKNCAIFYLVGKKRMVKYMPRLARIKLVAIKNMAFVLKNYFVCIVFMLA